MFPSQHSTICRRSFISMLSSPPPDGTRGPAGAPAANANAAAVCGPHRHRQQHDQQPPKPVACHIHCWGGQYCASRDLASSRRTTLVPRQGPSGATMALPARYGARDAKQGPHLTLGRPPDAGGPSQHAGPPPACKATAAAQKCC
jgi:hypothetical protein